MQENCIFTVTKSTIARSHKRIVNLKEIIDKLKCLFGRPLPSIYQLVNNLYAIVSEGFTQFTGEWPNFFQSVRVSTSNSDI
jgi:hypothetical protein